MVSAKSMVLMMVVETNLKRGRVRVTVPPHRDQIKHARLSYLGRQCNQVRQLFVAAVAICVHAAVASSRDGC